MSEAVSGRRTRVHPWLAPRIALPVAALLIAVNLPFLQEAFRGSRPVTAAVPFTDDFQRASVGPNYWSNGGLWRIVNGELFSPGVGNNPLWLQARLPKDARIDLDVRSEGPDGDIKWEAWGDGRNHSTGYLFLFGAWHNRESRIAKLDEHALTEDELRAELAGLARPYPQQLGGLPWLVNAVQQPFTRWSARRDLRKLEAGTYYGTEVPRVVKRMDLKVERGRRYHMTVIKQGHTIRWEIDGKPAMEFDDPAPLSGPGHDRFGFSSWQNDTYFDNLKITAL